jgi:hypothetical protein
VPAGACSILGIFRNASLRDNGLSVVYEEEGRFQSDGCKAAKLNPGAMVERPAIQDEVDAIG